MANGRNTKAGRAKYNAYMRVYMRRRYRRLKLEEGRKRFWSPEAIEWLHHAYPFQTTARLALAMGREPQAVFAKANALGIHKSLDLIREEGRRNAEHPDAVARRFKKGQAPSNKGLRRPGWAAGRMRETQFKPGVRQGVAVKLYKPIGTLRVTKDGYLSRKVNDDLPLQRRWKLEHVRIWEAANGPVPKGHAVKIVNGEKQDVRLENLTLISRADLMRLNTVHNLPKPLAELVQLRGALIRQINRREKRNGKQQDRGSARNSVRHAPRSPQQGEADGNRPRKGGR